MRVLAITNQKGGVGKTTTSINLAASLGARGRRVLLIDLDPQGNATMGSGVDKYQEHLSSYEVLLGQAGLKESMRKLPKLGYSLLSSNSDLTGAEILLLQLEQRETRLRRALIAVEGEFDDVLIDCPPSLNMLTINALSAAHSLLVPIQCEYYALEGIADLGKAVEHIRRSLNPRIEIEGVLRTMYDPRNNLANQVSEDLIRHFGDKIFQITIPRNVRLAEAPSHGLPVMFYDPQCSGAQAYAALADEFLARRKAAEPQRKTIRT